MSQSAKFIKPPPWGAPRPLPTALPRKFQLYFKTKTLFQIKLKKESTKPKYKANESNWISISTDSASTVSISIKHSQQNKLKVALPRKQKDN